MKNRIISISLAVILAFSVLLTFAGCGDNNYPVEVANFVIKSEPENIVVLDPSTADIISYIGYDVKMVGRSDEVNQSFLSIVPSVGSASSPDADEIINSGATVVFAGENLDDTVKQTLQSNDIMVITMSQAETSEQLGTNYLTLGKILGGKVTGSEKGSKAYADLLEEMNEVKTTVNESSQSAVLNTVCYLYYEDNNLKLMTNGTYGDMLLGYTGAVNVAVNIEENEVDVNTLKVANPNYVFYADDATLQAIQSDSILSGLTAVKTGKTLMVTQDEMTRQGYTAIETLNKMVNFMFPDLFKSEATPDEAVKSAVDTTSAQTTATEANATTATNATNATAASVADQYKIDLSNNLSLKYEDDNNNVKIMQKRLYDLGYVTDAENVTGYYGDVSKQAVTDFQKNNGINATGTADNATLFKMFSEDAVKAK